MANHWAFSHSGHCDVIGQSHWSYKSHPSHQIHGTYEILNSNRPVIPVQSSIVPRSSLHAGIYHLDGTSVSTGAIVSAAIDRRIGREPAPRQLESFVVKPVIT